MGDALYLLELLLVERNIVVLCNILQGLEQIVFHMLFALLLLDDNSPFEVEIIFLLEDVKKRGVGTPVDSDFLEFVAEVVFDGLLFEGVSCDNHVVFAF